MLAPAKQRVEWESVPVDPQEKMFAVMMVQMPFAQSGYYGARFPNRCT